MLRSMPRPASGGHSKPAKPAFHSGPARTRSKALPSARMRPVMRVMPAARTWLARASTVATGPLNARRA